MAEHHNQKLKGIVHPKEIHSLSAYHYADLGGGVKCLSLQNTFGVSGVNSVAAESNTIEENVDSFFKLKKNTQKNVIFCCSF